MQDGGSGSVILTTKTQSLPHIRHIHHIGTFIPGWCLTNQIKIISFFRLTGCTG